MDVKDTPEHRQMRRIAFVAVVLSTVAVIASVVTLPMLYNYVQSFQSHLMVETDYCKVLHSSYTLFILPYPMYRIIIVLITGSIS